MKSREEGFSMIELLVAFSIFAIISTSFYSMLFAGRRSSVGARDVARVSEEARLAFNRMVRDTRESEEFLSVSPTSFHVQVDFDRDGNKTENPNELGDYEDLTFAFNESDRTITLNGAVLMRGVSKVGSADVFSFSSSKLEYDASPFDGTVTLAELSAAQAAGSAIANPMSELNNVTFHFNVTHGDQSTDFFGQAQLRNRR